MFAAACRRPGRRSFVAIILLAGLQSIPPQLKESLSIDGGGTMVKFSI